MDYKEIITYIIVISVILISSFVSKKAPQKTIAVKPKPTVPEVPKQSLSSNSKIEVPSKKKLRSSTPAFISSDYSHEGGSAIEPITSLEEYIYDDEHPEMMIDADWRKAIVSAEILKTKF